VANGCWAAPGHRCWLVRMTWSSIRNPCFARADPPVAVAGFAVEPDLSDPTGCQQRSAERSQWQLALVTNNLIKV
jgi:hypothetical protein